jgi:hypothetical protein
VAYSTCYTSCLCCHYTCCCNYGHCHLCYYRFPKRGKTQHLRPCKAFKENCYFNSSWQNLQTTARSHKNVDNVINLSYVPGNQDEQDLLVEQKKFIHSVLEQTVLAPDGVLIIRVHSDTGDATVVCSDLVDCYGKSTAAQLAASELESDLAEFRIDLSWIKTNQAFLIAWTAKTLDFDSVLEQPITKSQKRIWFARAVSPKAVLSLAISHFDTSERLTAIGIGSSHTKARFSILRAAKGLPPKVPYPPRESRCFRSDATPSDVPTPKNIMISYAKVTDPAPTPTASFLL